MTPSKHRKLKIALAVLLVLGAAAGLFVWYNLFREVPVHYSSVEEYFKYGSVGTEQEAGLPYQIWRVLPTVFADKLPGEGYASLGYVYEPGKDIPIGLSKKTIGFERVGINCAFCHVTTYRASAQDEPKIVLAAPPQRFDVEAYERFLFAVAGDPRFNADTLIAAIEKVQPLSPVQSLLYRFALIPQTRKALLKQKERFSWMDEKPDWGPGRIDPFNDLKYHFAGLPRDKTVGSTDMMPLWNMQPRQELKSFHWDGLADDLPKILQNSAVGDGATGSTIPYDEMKRLEEYFLKLPPPKYPFPIDAALAAEGRPIFLASCGTCHEPGQERAGRIIPIEEIGTDRHRFDMWTPETPPGYNKFVKAAYGWEPQVRKMPGYTAVLLDGIWLRAPYLHNGAVPSLTDILEPPAQRTKVFYRGYDVYDPIRVGFVSTGPEVEHDPYFRFDTSVAGNGNGGHDYGTSLDPDSKRKLIEYMKTL